MRPEDQQAARRTGQVLRVTRKLFGERQKNIAGQLGVSQAALSKMENGQLIPSVSQWFHFCELYRLNAEFSFRTGLVDRCGLGDTKTDYESQTFKISKRYREEAGSRVRTVRLYLQLLERKFGAEAAQRYLEEVGIDPDFFCVLDNSINVSFSLDLIRKLMDRGAFKPRDLPLLAKPLTRLATHGRVLETVQKNANPGRTFGRFVQKMVHYDANFEYALDTVEERQLIFSVKPTGQCRDMQDYHQVCGSWLCKYREIFVQNVAVCLVNAFTTVTENECIYRGADRCRYEVRFLG